MRWIAVVLAALAAAAPASSASSPAVPPFIQNVVKAKAGQLAYVPTRLPFRYRYVRYRWNAESRQLTTWFADRRFPVNGKRTLAFTAEPFRLPLARCAEGRQRTLQMGGNKVYWDEGVAWRCLRGVGGGNVKLLASGPNLPDVALGRVVASGKRVR